MNWVEYFSKNHSSVAPIPWERGISIDTWMRKPFIHSLQRFQIGESGDGKHIRQGAAETGDKEYARAIELFIGEEQQHSRWMAKILEQLEAPLLKRHWSEVIFIVLRRFLGLRQELVVLLVAEMIAKRYFRALFDGTGDPVLKQVFRQILLDEENHLKFHIEYLSRAFLPLSIVRCGLIRLLWRILFRGACLVVIWDHRRILSACKVSPLRFWWDCGLVFDETASGIFYSVPGLEASPSFFGRASTMTN